MSETEQIPEHPVLCARATIPFKTKLLKWIIENVLIQCAMCMLLSFGCFQMKWMNETLHLFVQHDHRKTHSKYINPWWIAAAFYLRNELNNFCWIKDIFVVAFNTNIVYLLRRYLFLRNDSKKGTIRTKSCLKYIDESSTKLCL